MELIAYPVRNKQKSRDILSAFLAGVGGEISSDGVYQPGKASVFWGVDASNQDAYRAAKLHVSEAPYFYGDNSYFDVVRGKYFRFTRNALQHDGCGFSHGKRFEELNVKVASLWKANGAHIVLCEQSPYFMNEIAGVGEDWASRTAATLHEYTSRPIALRSWNPDKIALGKTLLQDLEGAHALVTWSSAAAVEAVLAGVPIFCDEKSATASVGRWNMAKIEEPYRPSRGSVIRWAHVLADNQWTLDELKRGVQGHQLRI